MEKIVIAIIVLNIIASIIAKSKKKKALESATAKKDKAPPSKPDRTKSPEKFFSSDTKSSKKPASKTLSKSLSTGKSILQEVAKEFGLDLEENSTFNQAPPVPVTREIHQESGQSFDDYGFQSDIPRHHTQKKQPSLVHSSSKKSPVTSTPKIPKSTNTTSVSPHSIQNYLKNKKTVRDAIIFKTILDRPVAMQKRGEILCPLRIRN
ncbi:MAG: hypothetical protein HQK83_15370 [Fibrobacteria bacterium]|nr:hypothetical protein [Fibrobacteria bacterium]